AAYGQTVSVHYGTADGTATLEDGDYQVAYGTLTFAPGETSKNVSVLVNGDRLYEDSESFDVKLFDPTNAFVADPTGVGTILNDEPTFSVINVSAVDGNTGTTPLTFTITLSAAYEAPVSMNYATADGTATVAGGDYQATSGTLTFAPGETSKTLTVLV